MHLANAVGRGEYAWSRVPLRFKVADVFWGGHVGYFRAPDGTIWEVAFNPMAPLSPDGAFRWDGY